MTPDKMTAAEWMESQLSKAVIRQQIMMHMEKMRKQTSWFWDYQCERLTEIDGIKRVFCSIIADLDTCRSVLKTVKKSRRGN